MGLVEVSGLAVGPYTLVAPVTARTCYYYRTVVWEWKQSGKNKNWVKVAGECMHVPFFVDDNTGRALVDPRGADLDLHRDFEQEFCDSFFTTKEPMPGNVRSFLARHGIVTNNKIKVEEYCIKPKNSLFVLGTLGENPGMEASPQPILDAEPTNSFSAQGLSFSINSHALFSHEDGEGSAAGVAAAGGVQVLADPAAPLSHGDNSPSNTGSSGQANGFDPHPPVVLMKGTNNRAFLISWRSQKEVARALGWKCALMIWGGPALALISLYFFLGIKNLF